MLTKCCSTCKTEKPLIEFGKQSKNKDGLKYSCKLCSRQYSKEYHSKNYPQLKERMKERAREYYYENKNNPEYKKEVNRRVRKSYYKHQQKRLAATKEWHSNNRDAVNERKRNRYAKNIQHKMAELLRTRLRKCLKGNSKISSTLEYLGCSLEELQNHLESQFQEGMTWDNWTIEGWHIDHIKPLASFDLSKEEDIYAACHYTNLQPLWSEENIRKGAS